MNVRTPSRRTLLLGAGGFAVVGAGAGALAFTGTLNAYICDLVRTTLNGEKVDEEGLNVFAGDCISRMDTGTVSKSTLLAQGARIVSATGIDFALGSMGGYAAFKRSLVTQYLLGSNYFYRSQPTEPVTYLSGPQACVNPFARFDD